MNQYLTLSEIAQTLNISESTLRRRLKKLPGKTLSTLSKIDRGKVYFSTSILSTLSTLSTIDRPINDHTESKEIVNTEIEYLRKLNDNFINTINDKDQQIKDLTSLIVKLQNDINTYIKLLDTSKSTSTNYIDILLKISLAISLIGLMIYLLFG